MSRIVDLSLTLRPDVRGVSFEPRSTVADRGWNTTMLRLYSHAGTHLDAPHHFIDGGRTMEALDLEKCVGPARVIDLTFLKPRDLITVEHLAPYADRIGPGTRLLLKTGWSTHADLPDYRTHFPRVSLPLARWLAERKIALLGVEPPAVADVNDAEELITIHRTLLGAEIVIVEGLANLDALTQEEVTFIALPLKLEGGDGSPVRAIAVEEDSERGKELLSRWGLFSNRVTLQQEFLLSKQRSTPMTFPTTHIGPFELSRMLIGTNPFFGYSHFSHARDTWLRRYFTPERIYEVIEACARQGLNGIVSGAGTHFNTGLKPILEEVERNTGVHVAWIGTPAGRTLEELLEEVRAAADRGVEICMPHQMYTDNMLVPNEGRLIGYEEAAQLIRDLGMVPGLSTHRPETITTCDKAGYDVAAYIQPYNPIGFLCPLETDSVARFINGTGKPVIVIKPLAAGRVLPPTGLNFCYSTIKPIDTVCIGMLSVEEVEEDVNLARSIIAGVEAQRQYTYSRSKKVHTQEATGE